VQPARSIGTNATTRAPDWLDWPEHPNLLPAVDQWSWIDRHGLMHPLSLSVLVEAITAIVESPAIMVRSIDPQPVRQITLVTPEEEVEVLAWADELNARIAGVLAEYG
jgi:hypothetical protein